MFNVTKFFFIATEIPSRTKGRRKRRRTSVKLNVSYKMTSWLDTKKYVASLAKNAIAEAQKTLDKALDIDENGEQEETEQSEA